MFISGTKLGRQIKARLGDLWWYTLIMFCVQRFGDAVNLFTGLWLVPLYVPQAELGAVLPLVQVGYVLALPLMVFLGPFNKFLNTYATRGETGKVKALLRDGLLLAVLIFVATMLYARIVMPPVFERMRVAEGSLGFLIVLSGVVAATAQIPTTALQGLKNFRMITYAGLLSAPLRLLTMLVCLPIRGLSGYFVGQTAPYLLSAGIGIFGLRHVLSRKIQAMPYLRTDGRRILAYMMPCGVLAGIGILQMAVETFVIRHQLPDIESAAYYMISRFAEASGYLSTTMLFVSFPLMAERHVRGESSTRLLWHTVWGTLATGLLASLAFCCMGSWLFLSVPTLRPYAAFIPHLVALTVLISLRGATFCLINHELACDRFAFVGCVVGPLVAEMIVLYAVTGYRFFTPYIPVIWLTNLAAFNPCRLSVVIDIMLFFAVIVFVALLVHKLTRKPASPIFVTPQTEHAPPRL